MGDGDDGGDGDDVDGDGDGDGGDDRDGDDDNDDDDGDGCGGDCDDHVALFFFVLPSVGLGKEMGVVRSAPSLSHSPRKEGERG